MDVICCCLEIVITLAMQPWVVAMALATLMCFTSTCYFIQMLSRTWHVEYQHSGFAAHKFANNIACRSTKFPTIHVRYSDVILES